MSGHCYVYPIQSPPDHMSILSSTLNENLNEFIVDGNLQTLIVDDTELVDVLSRNMSLQELLVALHTHWGIGSLPGGLSTSVAREIQLKRLKAFQYIYNLATLNYRPWSGGTLPLCGNIQLDSVYYLDAIPRVFTETPRSSDTVVVGRQTFNFCRDIISNYPYLIDTEIQTIQSTWTDAARDEYRQLYGSTNDWGILTSIPMLNSHGRGGSDIALTTRSFNQMWQSVNSNMLTKLQHHYTQKIFGVDTRTSPTPLKPHGDSQTEAVRYRYFEYLTEFQSERTPEKLREKLHHTQEESDEDASDIPKLSQIPGDIYYRMQYLTVNTTDSWLVVYNQLDEFTFDSQLLAGRENIITEAVSHDENLTPLAGASSEDDISNSDDSYSASDTVPDPPSSVNRVLDFGDSMDDDNGSNNQNAGASQANRTTANTIRSFLSPHTIPNQPYMPNSPNSVMGNLNGLVSPIYDILEIPEGTRLKYISYWERHDVVLCYCDGATSIPIRNRRNISEVLATLVSDLPISDTRDAMSVLMELPGGIDSIPNTLRVGTARSFYVYLPRRLVSCKVLDVNQQHMTLVSLSDPGWGSPEFYTKYVIRPNHNDTSGANQFVTPNGECRSMGWAVCDILKAIQFSGITLNHDTFKHTHQSLLAYRRNIMDNTRELDRLHPRMYRDLTYRQRNYDIFNIMLGERNLYHQLLRETRKYNLGVMFTKYALAWDHAIPAIFGIHGIPEQINLGIPVRSYTGIRRQSARDLYRFIVTYDNLSTSGYNLTIPDRTQLEECRQMGEWGKKYFNYYGLPQLNLYLTMVVDCLTLMTTRIQRRRRLTLPSIQPQNEWQRLCGQIHKSDVDDNRLREIVVANSRINHDPNRHLTMDGLSGLDKRRLCKLLVMQQMRDDRVKVQGIKKLIDRNRERQTELNERYPEPLGLCTNLNDSMDIVTDQISSNINHLCLLHGKCQEIKNFFERYQNTKYSDFVEKVQMYDRVRELSSLPDSSDNQAEIDQLTVGLGSFVDEWNQFKENVITVFRSSIINPVSLMGGDPRYIESNRQNVLRDYITVLEAGDFTTIHPPSVPRRPRQLRDGLLSDIREGIVNWERDKELTFNEWQEHYFSINWQGLFQQPINRFINQHLMYTIHDYTEYLNPTNPQYKKASNLVLNRIRNIILTSSDIQEICENYGRDSPTYQVAQPGDYFIFVRSDYQSRCIHRSWLDVAQSHDNYICEWVAPVSHPGALSDPRFDTGMYYDEGASQYIMLQPRVPARIFYPIILSETTQGVDTAYFTHADFTRIKTKVEQSDGSIQVFYLGDGTSVRMGNCGGNFGESQTHGQRDIAFQYRIKYHREISPDRIEALSNQPVVQLGVAQEGSRQQVDQVAEIFDLRQQQQQFNQQTLDARGDRVILRQINRNKRYVARKIEWLTMDPDATPETRERVRQQAQQDYVTAQEQIDSLEPESEREALHQAVEQQWSGFLTMTGDTQ